MGTRAAELIHRQIQGQTADGCRRVSLDADLVVRSSTAPPS
jgi:DNA-binding LacI/PurR family transcriptional regulator